MHHILYSCCNMGTCTQGPLKKPFLPLHLQQATAAGLLMAHLAPRLFPHPLHAYISLLEGTAFETASHGLVAIHP